MKKYFALFTIFAISFISVTTASAIQFSAAGGDPVELDTADPNFDPFTPSTNVSMSGQTAVAGYAANSWHIQVLTKKSGKAFGMSSDSNAVYWADISANDATVEAVDTSDSTYFDANTWTKM